MIWRKTRGRMGSMGVSVEMQHTGGPSVQGGGTVARGAKRGSRILPCKVQPTFTTAGKSGASGEIRTLKRLIYKRGCQGTFLSLYRRRGYFPRASWWSKRKRVEMFALPNSRLTFPVIARLSSAPPSESFSDLTVSSP